jgi:hypothetical protein
VADPSTPCPQQRLWLPQAAGLYIVALLPRLLDLGAFITWDELIWVHRSVHFSQAILSSDWAATFRTGHPGVIATWLGALGMGLRWLLIGAPSSTTWSALLQLPALDPRDADALRQLAPLLVAAKIPVALFSALTVVGFWALARQVMDPQIALWAGLLNALDPFFLSHSRVFHLDALLTSFMSLGLLSLLIHLHYPTQLRWLLLSALAGGLAALTKTPALFLLPVASILLAAQRRGRVRAVLLWAGIATATYVALWPAMWVAPLDTLRSVLEKALGYASYAEETAQFFRGTAVADPGALFYPVVFLFRSSPLALFGLLAALSLWWKGDDGKRRLWSALAAYALLYGIVMTLGAKKFDRYLLPLYLPLNLLAAMGWTRLSWAFAGSAARRTGGGQQVAADRWRLSPLRHQPPATGHRRVALVGGVTLTLIQGLLVFPYHPHYLAWYNPLLGGLRQAVRVLPVGWGEGLQEAAAYLNAQPDAEKLTVASAGVPGMAPKFRGRTLPLTPSSLADADYVVIYVSDRQGGLSPVDDFIADAVPRYVVRLQGVEYAWVYSNESYREPLALLASAAGAGDALLIAGPSLVARHYDGSLPSHVLQGEESEARVAGILRHLAAGRERMWYIQFPSLVSPPGEIAHYHLAARAYLAWERTVPLATLLLYQLPEDASFAPTELQAGAGPFTFGGRLRLTRYGVADPSIGWGQELGVQLGWEVLTPPKADYTAFLHLVDHKGHLWGQVDLPLRNEAAESTASWRVGAEEVVHYLLSPWPGIPPGRYQLVAGVYASDTQQLLPVTDGQGNPLGGSTALSPVQVISSPIRTTPEDLSIPYPLRRKLGDSTLVLGYNVWPSPVQPGTSLHLEIFWLVQAPPGEDYKLLLELGRAQEIVAIPNAYYPSSQWQAGDLLRGHFRMLIPPGLSPGEYPLRINLVRPDGSHLSSEPISVVSVQVQGRPRSFEAPSLSHPLDLRLGDGILLLGYDLADPRPDPGGTLHLTLYWQAQGPTDVAYTVFTHLLGPQGLVVAQSDSPPQGGAAPTTSWLAGEVIADEYWIPVPSELPPGPLYIEVGMYDPATGDRLPIHDAQDSRLSDDRVLLMPLEGE